MDRKDILIIIAFIIGFLFCNFLADDRSKEIERLKSENKRLKEYRWAFITLADKCDTIHDGCLSEK